jgi:iron complex transport system substrate-binding protein
MTRAIPLLACLLAGCAPAAETSRGRIVSLNPCSDQLLLALVPPERIAAISHYSQDPNASSIDLALARRMRATAGTAEEVIELAPDLVVATSYTPPATRAAFARAGLRTLYLDSPTSIAASKVQIAEVAKALGAEERGRLLNRRIDAAVAAAARSDAPVSALLFISGSFVNGGPTLLGELMGRAGLRDATPDYGVRWSGTLPVEAIVSHPPAVILAPPGGGRTAVLRQRTLRQVGARTIELPFPHRLLNCGGPTIIPALETLSAVRRKVAA